MSRARAAWTLSFLREGEGVALLLAGPPLLVSVLAQGLFELTGFDIVGLGEAVAAQLGAPGSRALPAALAESETRVLWSLTLLLNLGSAITLTAVAVMILCRSVSERGLRLFVPTTVVLIVLGLASFVYAAQAQTPISGLFTFTYGSLEATGLFGGFFLGAVKFFVVLLNVLSIVAPVSALMAACSTLAPPRDGGPGDVAFLGGQARFLKTLVVLGSVYMVAGVLHLGVWLSWPATFVGDAELAGQIRSYARSMSIYWGGAFTVLIAAFYVPALVVLRRRAEAAIARLPDSTGGLTPEKFLADHGLSLAVSQQLPQIVAVLAPLLAGPLGSAVADFSKIAGLGG